MKKWAIAAGIFMLLLTIILFTANRTTAIAYPTQLAGSTDTSKTSEWEYEGNFSKNDIILVDLLQNIFWSENTTYFDVVNGVPTLWVDVNITDPAGTTTAFQLQYTYQPTDVQQRLLAYNITTLFIGVGINPKTPIAEHGLTFVAGTATLDGTYLANVTSVGSDVYEFRDTSYKPSWFALYKAYAVETYPYASLFYGGFVTIPAALAFSAYGLKKDDRKKKKIKG